MSAVLIPNTAKSVPDEASNSPERSFDRLGLSKQESRVVSLAVEGNIDKQIALKMGISLGTVRVYWRRIRYKTGGSRSEAIASLARNASKLAFDELFERSEQLQVDLDARANIDRSIRLYEAAFRKIALPIAVVDGPTSTVNVANSAFADALGLSIEELEGQVLPNSRPTLSDLHRTESSDIDRVVITRKDGTEVPFALTGENDAIFVLYPQR